MPENFEVYFQMPILPFTLLVGMVTAYWLMMILGAIDLDFLDFDLDLDADIDVDADASFLDWGLVGLKWFNLGDVPLMVWMSVFGTSAWCMSLYFDQGLAEAGTQQMVTAILRNIGVGLFVAKGITQPLKGKLKLVEPNKIAELLGRTCEVTTVEATDQFGQAQCHAEGAPLLLNIKTIDGNHTQGALVEIVDYEPDEKVFLVRSADEASA